MVRHTNRVHHGGRLLFQERRHDRAARPEGRSAARADRRHGYQLRHVRRRVRRRCVRAVVRADGRLGRHARRCRRLCTQPLCAEPRPTLGSGGGTRQGRHHPGIRHRGRIRDRRQGGQRRVALVLTDAGVRRCRARRQPDLPCDAVALPVGEREYVQHVRVFAQRRGVKRRRTDCGRADRHDRGGMARYCGGRRHRADLPAVSVACSRRSDPGMARGPAGSAGSLAMTLGRISTRRPAMLRRLWSFLLVMIASSLVMTATVHAREIPGPVTIECSGTVHSDGDADQSQGDADKAVPHHHATCHGQTLDVPASDTLPSIARVGGLRPFPTPASAIASHVVDPALRPPAA
ncbi:conserved hypothetical protein [Sphingomonas aurantiaca]|uniref:DUF2946 domain-containing protein n=2 Tax=Sphingomonas aurantiaca TaxID=185949 RepID=A0A5E7XSQ2_9SPHN|nr:conserved hypothetical protein [Sphingomonas aurantiaca]